MKITYWSDFNCPYCYIGNMRLKRAIDELNLNDEIEIEIKAFELDLNAPEDVEDTTVNRFAQKYGLSIEDAEREVENISKLGTDEGIDFKYATALFTNSRDAHRLMKFCQDNNPDLTDKLSETLFDAYFSKNLKLANRDVLISISQKTGLKKEDVEMVLDSDLYDDEVEADEQLAFSKGIHAVPHYIFDDKYHIPGALSAGDFKRVLNQIKIENSKAYSCSDGTCSI